MSAKEMLGIVSALAIGVLAVAVVSFAGPIAAAQAEPAQQFNLEVDNTKPDSPATVRFRLRTYDTTGAVPPLPTANYLRLPLGVAVRKEFLNKRYYCDGPALRDALDAHLSATPFTRRIANLKPFIRSLARSKSKADRKALAIARVCERARIGGGTGKIDARNVASVLTDPIPVTFVEFLSRGELPGSIFGFTILGAADESSSVARRFPVVTGVHAAITLSVVDDPTPDGLYGPKLVFSTGPIGGFAVSIAEIDTTVGDLKIAKGTCLATDRRGRCTRRQRADVFPFVLPKCPPSGHLNAELLSVFAPPVSNLSTTLEMPCPRFHPQVNVIR